MRDIETLNEFNFHSILAGTPGVSLILFGYSGCSACRRWKLLLREYLGTGTPVSVFEVDAQSDQGLTRNFAVFHLPALFLYRDGQYHRELQTEARLDSLNREVSAALSMPAQEPP